jgi:importin subunit alpha-6/7
LEKAQIGSSFLRNASWTLSNLCRGKIPPEYKLIERAIPALVKVLIENDNVEILIDVCWALSYLSDSGEDRVMKMLEYPIIPRLIKLLADNQISVAIPSLRTIGNIATGNDE